jgi:hypothetical protein
MPLPVSGQVGEQIIAPGVTTQPLRQGRLASVIVSELDGRYYEQALNKRIFVAYSAARALSLVGTAMVGLQLWNGSPVTGGVNLVLLKTAGMISVTSATTTGIVLARGLAQTGAPTSQTAADLIANGFIGGPAPQATATALATFTNAPAAMALLMHNTAAIATTGEDQGYLVDFEGSIIVPPQSYVAIAALGAAAGAAAWTGHLMWTEVPA